MQTYREEMTEVLEKAIRSKCSSVEFDENGKYHTLQESQEITDWTLTA